MTKQEQEQKIIEGIMEIKREHDEEDREQKEWEEDAREHGTAESFLKGVRYYNGYVYTSEVINVIAKVVIGKDAMILQDVRGGYIQYADNLTLNEKITISTIIEGMVSRKMLEPTKTKRMFKVLIEG